MNSMKRMILGYILGGFVVLIALPYLVYTISKLADRLYRIEIVSDVTTKWILIVVLFVFGICFGIWSIVIQNVKGEGGPLEGFGIEISPKTKHLIVSGPYRYTRNPMLLGTFSMYLALSVMINSINSLIIVMAFMIFMLVVVVRNEEKRLAKDFGNEYEEYKKRVSMLIPWFHKKE